MKPVTLKTFLSARYCMLFTVRYCWTNELKDYTEDCNGQIAWLAAVPTLPYSVVLFYSRYQCVFSSLLRIKLWCYITTVYVLALILVLPISLRYSHWFLTPCTVQFVYILYAFFCVVSVTNKMIFISILPSYLVLLYHHRNHHNCCDLMLLLLYDRFNISKNKRIIIY
jgi:hypothetical protein